MKENRLKDLKQRLIVSFFSIIIVVILITFAFHPIFRILLAAILALIAAVGIWEYANMSKAKNFILKTPLILIASICEIFSFFIASQFEFLNNLPLITFFTFFVLFFISYFREIEGALAKVASSTFGFIYISIPLGMLLPILFLTSSKTGQDGRFWVGYLIIVTGITDIGAYFGGRLLGRKKLAPNISPQKTLEGAIIGLIFAVLASMGFSALSHRLFESFFELSLYKALFLGVFLGAFGQLGDLAESLLKRDAKIKDSNNLKGLGGVLDMVDSLLFNIPVLYFFLMS